MYLCNIAHQEHGTAVVADSKQELSFWAGKLSGTDGICGQLGTERKTGKKSETQGIEKVKILACSGRNTVAKSVNDVETPDEVGQYHKRQQGRK